jgi:hypothetical protein
VLLARVMARSGEISAIDISQVNSLQNMETEISKFALEYIVNHHHGGTQSYDPPKIRLETDIRSTVIGSFNKDGIEIIRHIKTKIHIHFPSRIK